MENWLLALGIATVAACSSASTSPDAAPTPTPTLDPTGNWSVVYAFDASCGNPASTTTGTFTVTVGPHGYDIEVAGVLSTGVLACDASTCHVSGTWAWKTTDTSYQQSMNLMLDSANAVTGNGTEEVITATSNCTYPFTVTGSRM